MQNHTNYRFIAEFLHDCGSKLDKTQIGDFLGAHDDRVLTNTQYSELRLAYIGAFDFTGMAFDNGLRTFLCEGGFRLPGESQKIDRLLDAFCKVFVRQNPVRVPVPGIA